MKKPTTWRPNSRLPAPTKAIARTKPPSKRNVKRLKKLREAAFGGGKAEFVRSLPCVVGKYARGDAGCAGEVQACHAKSRGAGGDSTHLTSMCARHHELQHRMGIATFEALYVINLRMAADLCEALYQAEILYDES